MAVEAKRPFVKIEDINKMKEKIAEILEFELSDFFQVRNSSETPNWEEESKFQEYGFVTRKEFAEYVKVVTELQAKLNEIQNKLSQ